MRNLSLGIMIGVLICMGILSFFPEPETELACQQCNECWWFDLAEGDE